MALLATITLGAAITQASPSLLSQYETQARATDASFKSASADRGNALYHREYKTTSGEMKSCATCHGTDPRSKGKTRANKMIESMAVSTNPSRFSDVAKVEKWFTRNCNDVLGTVCSAGEKADFIQYLTSLK